MEDEDTSRKLAEDPWYYKKEMGAQEEIRISTDQEWEHSKSEERDSY